MSKRFTSTEKYDDPWYRKLSPTDKCFWDYLYLRCDNAGIWKIDYELAEVKINGKFDESIIQRINNGKERVRIKGDVAVIRGFIEFQIGNLAQEKLTNLQKNCLKLLDDYINVKGFVLDDFGLLTGSLPVAIGYKNKGKGKDKGISKGKDKGNSTDKYNPVKPGAIKLDKPESIETVIDRILGNHPEVIDQREMAEGFFEYYETNGWVQGHKNKPIKNWHMALSGWIRRSKDHPKQIPGMNKRMNTTINNMQSWIAKKEKEDENRS